MILVSLSTITMLLSAIFVIALTGDFMSPRIDENDLILTQNGAYVKFKVAISTMIIIEVSSDHTARMDIILEDPGGDDIYNRSGKTTMSFQKQIERSGTYHLKIEAANPLTGLPDLELSITWTGISSLIFCMLSMITAMIAVPALIFGTVLTIIEIKYRRINEKGKIGRRRHRR